jgi:hypothetical protein
MNFPGRITLWPFVLGEDGRSAERLGVLGRRKDARGGGSWVMEHAGGDRSKLDDDVLYKKACHALSMT